MKAKSEYYLTVYEAEPGKKIKIDDAFLAAHKATLDKLRQVQKKKRPSKRGKSSGKDKS